MRILKANLINNNFYHRNRFLWIASDKYTVCTAHTSTKDMNNSVDHKHVKLWNNCRDLKFCKEALVITKCVNLTQYVSLWGRKRFSLLTGPRSPWHFLDLSVTCLQWCLPPNSFSLKPFLHHFLNFSWTLSDSSQMYLFLLVWRKHDKLLTHIYNYAVFQFPSFQYYHTAWPRCLHSAPLSVLDILESVYWAPLVLLTM